ncbi:MAG: GNAT family N-acetyltransferase [Bdellovibrionota bacterium]
MTLENILKGIWIFTINRGSRSRSNIEKGECHIVIADGEPIACVMLRPPGNATGPDWYSQPGVATFGRFAVAPDFQKLGNRIEERAKEMGATEIALDTSEHAQHLIKMYADRGYRFIQYHKWEITNYRSVVLSKELK